jgi:cell division septum initiation protein DivIVA
LARDHKTLKLQFSEVLGKFQDFIQTQEEKYNQMKTTYEKQISELTEQTKQKSTRQLWQPILSAKSSLERLRQSTSRSKVQTVSS